jgi:cytochrome c oxidase subunit 3
VVHTHEAHLAHHFETSAQQFNAAKLGMWLFLATEVLLFGGLFCLYAVLRGANPEMFNYGSQFLDTRWGIINTAVLITSSMTMAIGVTAAQKGQYRLLVSMLLVTFIGGAGFMTVKFIEYHHKIHEGLLWGTSFYEPPEWAFAAERERLTAGSGGIAMHDADIVATHVPDLGNGQTLWNAVCRSCHGAGGEGVTGQGKDIRGVEFVTQRSDQEMLEFITVGRQIADPLNTTGVQMPPRGGNPLLKDGDLLDIIAHVRTFEAGPDTAVAEEEFWIPVSSVPPANDAPGGLNPEFVHPALVVEAAPAGFPHHAFDAERPRNTHLFFGLYFLMTGLHGVHVLIGMIVIAWLVFRAVRRDFGPRYFTPVDLGGLYWHVVDLIWIFLFPMLYLIG